MVYRQWLDDGARRRLRQERLAKARRAMVRVLTRMTTTPGLRRAGDLGMRVMFNRLAPQWEQIRAEPVYRDTFRAGLDSLPQVFPVLTTPPRTVLDVACGTGIATGMLTERFPRSRVVGMDISDKMVRLAQGLVPRAEFVVGSATGLPFGVGEFQLVTSLDGVFVASELARVMAPGGALLLVYSKGNDCPVARPTAQLKAELEAAGLQVQVREESAWYVWALKPVPMVI